LSGEVVRGAENVAENASANVLKTFPGRTVLPASYYERNTSAIRFDLSSNQTGVASEPSNAEQVNPIQNEVAPKQQVPVAMEYSVNVPQTEPVNNSGSGQNVPTIYHEPAQENVSGRQAVQYQQASTQATTIAPVAAMTETGSTPVYVTTSRAIVLPVQTVQNVVATQEVSGTQQIAPVSLSALRVVPAAQSFPIYYYNVFTDDERTSFEQQVLAQFLSESGVVSITVSMNSDNVIKVDVVQDGKVITKYFHKDAEATTWNEVKYVQRFFYGDELRYVVVPVTD
jgi:hypothetical protein